MDLIDRIDEATKKPSFIEYFFNEKNYRKLQKTFDRHQQDAANEYGQDLADQESEYFEGEEVSGDEAYDQFAHTMGYQAEWDAAYYTILDNKNKYDYKRGDESDQNELVDEFIDYMGYQTDFVSRRSKTRQDYWKKYGGK